MLAWSRATNANSFISVCEGLFESQKWITGFVLGHRMVKSGIAIQRKYSAIRRKESTLPCILT